MPQQPVETFNTVLYTEGSETSFIG